MSQLSQLSLCGCHTKKAFSLQTKVPPSFLGYTHVGKLVYITQDGEVLINPSHDNTVDDDEVQELVKSSKQPEQSPVDGNDDDWNDESSSALKARNEKYEKMIKLVPGPLKDHMPDFYLQPLVRLFEKEKSGKSFEK
jgi:hypothetical protein